MAAHWAAPPRTRRRRRPRERLSLQDERMRIQRLEGSRFGTYLVTLATFVSKLIPPKRAITGGSRERLLALQLCRVGLRSTGRRIER